MDTVLINEENYPGFLRDSEVIQIDNFDDVLSQPILSPTASNIDGLETQTELESQDLNIRLRHNATSNPNSKKKEICAAWAVHSYSTA